MISARHQGERGISAAVNAVTEARNANSYAVLSNRPWIGTVPAEPDALVIKAGKEAAGEFVEFQYMWKLKNGGHRPARLEKVLTSGHFYKNVCSDKPTFPTPKDVPFPINNVGQSNDLVLPGENTYSPFATGIPMAEWREASNWNTTNKVWCIYLSIEYIDVGDAKKQPSHVRACKMYVPILGTMAECQNDYGYSD